MRHFSLFARALAALLIACALLSPQAAKADDPIRIGLSVSLTGAVAPIGKQVLSALQIWRDDTNAKGGLLGRPFRGSTRSSSRSTKLTC
jgi:branched-chain amino acid transport system substrate-binding protein